MDETNTYNGTPTGTPTFVQGYAGQAIAFATNSNQMVSTGYIAFANRTFSMTAWIYATALTNIIQESICGLCPATGTDKCLHMTLQKSGSNYRLYYGLYGDDVNNNTRPVLINNWVHAAFTFDATTRKASIYHNGILVTAGTLNGQLKSTTGTFQIGTLPTLVPSYNTFQVPVR